MRPALQQLQGKKGLVIAEIGVALGCNAKEMMEGLDLAKLYLIDPYLQYVQNGEVLKPFEKFSDVVADLEACKGETELVWMPCSSFEASHLIADRSLDGAYIDGNHAEPFVALDIRVWFPKVKKGGLIGGHDYGHKEAPGVKKAVDKAFPKPNRLCTISPNDWWLIKEIDIKNYDWWTVKKDESKAR